MKIFGLSKKLICTYSDLSPVSTSLRSFAIRNFVLNTFRFFSLDFYLSIGKFLFCIHSYVM